MIEIIHIRQFILVIYHVQASVWAWHIEGKDLNLRRTCWFSGQELSKEQSIESGKQSIKDWQK